MKNNKYDDPRFWILLTLTGLGIFALVVGIAAGVEKSVNLALAVGGVIGTAVFGYLTYRIIGQQGDVAY